MMASGHWLLATGTWQLVTGCFRSGDCLFFFIWTSVHKNMIFSPETSSKKPENRNQEPEARGKKPEASSN
jgi:hypothetical protein